MGPLSFVSVLEIGIDATCDDLHGNERKDIPQGGPV